MASITSTCPSAKCSSAETVHARHSFCIHPRTQVPKIGSRVSGRAQEYTRPATGNAILSLPTTGRTKRRVFRLRLNLNVAVEQVQVAESPFAIRIVYQLHDVANPAHCRVEGLNPRKISACGVGAANSVSPDSCNELARDWPRRCECGVDVERDQSARLLNASR